MIPIPLPRTKKGLKITLAVLAAISLGLTILCYVLWSGEQQSLRENGRPSFNTLPAEKLDTNLMTQGVIDVALGVYAEGYESNLGLRTSDKSTELYYVIPVYDESTMMPSYLITYKATPLEYETLDKVVEQTWMGTGYDNYLTVESAGIAELSDELKGYYLEWARDPSFYENGSFVDWCAEYDVFGTDDPAAIESKLVPYRIYQSDGTDPVLIYVLGGMTVLLLIGLVLVIRYKNPIMGFEDDPIKEDFSKLRDLD